MFVSMLFLCSLLTQQRALSIENEFSRVFALRPPPPPSSYREAGAHRGHAAADHNLFMKCVPLSEVLTQHLNTTSKSDAAIFLVQMHRKFSFTLKVIGEQLIL